MHCAFPIRRGKLGRLLILLVALAASGLSEHAQSAPRIADAADPLTRQTPPATLLPIDQLTDWLRQQPGFPQGEALRVDIDWPASQHRQKLAPCQQAEAFLPGSARPWGRLNIGIRCVAGARWTAWQPVHVRVFGSALVAREPLAAGQVPRLEDFQVQEVEWSRHPNPPAKLDIQLAGYQLQRALAAGQPLRTDHLRTLPAIRAGEVVSAIAEGNGFRISTDAIALASANEGQRVRVKTTSGKVLTGQVEGKNVKIFR
ncbi:MAG: flagellar basal body P-ring formation chaperone FlgA [Lautropia sp.]|nr:flagellar basal body P-ring formation chaperone FlgA [Lautropia sp.]